MINAAFVQNKLGKPLWLIGITALVSCGVVEHSHGSTAVDGSNDFGPSLAGAASQAGNTGIASGGAAPSGAGAPSSAGGALAAGGAPASAGGALATGGTTASGAGTSGAGTTAAGASGAPGSTVTINLGGTEVPMDHAIAFIHIGHSNMAGEASTPQASHAWHYSETNPHAYMYHIGTSPELAIEPKTCPTTTLAGPGTALVKEAVALAPSYYFISLGYAQPSAYCSQFLPGSLYYDDLIAAAKNIKGRVTFGAIFIYLGITERHGTAADISGFPSCINSLVTAIRTDVGVPDLPALMNDYEVEGSGDFAVGGAVATAIMPEIAKTPSVVSNFALVSAAKLGMQDDHHFDLDGQRVWAQRALATMQQKGWFKWTGN